jgi:hypothetical protein
LSAPRTEARARLEELWARWLADGALALDEQQELATALADDESVRNDFLGDQRIEGALCALGRSASDGNAFARRFAERVAAERDGRGFVSSVERQLAAQSLAKTSARRAWWLLPAAAALVLAVVAVRAGRPRPATPVTTGDEIAVRASAETPNRGTLPAAVARVDSATGALFLDGARKIEARPGAWLLSGWGLVTVGAGSRAAISFADGTSLALGGDSALLQVGERAREGRGKEAFLARGRLTAEVTPQAAGRPMLLTTPQAQATVVGTRFTLTVDGRSTRLDVEHGAVQIAGLAGGAPALVHASEYALVVEGSTAVRARARGVALMLVGNLSLQYDDERVKHRLESLGFEVRVRGAGPPDPAELRQVALVLVSSSVFSLDLNTLYRDVPVPVLVWEPSLYDDFGMTGPEEDQGCGVAAGVGEALIRSPAHPMAGGLEGAVTVVTNGKNLHHIWMTYGTPGPAAAWVATWPGVPNRAVLFGYERGAAMPGLAAAPARRVGFFFYDDGRLHLTDAGWTLFDAAVTWAAGR